MLVRKSLQRQPKQMNRRVYENSAAPLSYILLFNFICSGQHNVQIILANIYQSAKYLSACSCLRLLSDIKKKYAPFKPQTLLAL